MSIEDFSFSNPLGNVHVPTPARREGKDVIRDDGVLESTALIRQDILDGLANDIQQLTQECSQFKDISFSDFAPANVTALTQAQREGKDNHVDTQTAFFNGRRVTLYQKSYISSLGDITYQ